MGVLVDIAVALVALALLVALVWIGQRLVSRQDTDKRAVLTPLVGQRIAVMVARDRLHYEVVGLLQSVGPRGIVLTEAESDVRLLGFPTHRVDYIGQFALTYGRLSEVRTTHDDRVIGAW